jgi:hypothetical protein
MDINKSQRHSKITGDFAEGLVLYWLSKYGYECARIDHVGIDLIACRPDAGERRGISVKCRSRYDGTENESVNLPPDGFDKAITACDVFGLVPHYAIVVDGAGSIRCFLMKLSHLKEIVGGTEGGMRYWQMNDKSMSQYRDDPQIEQFELRAAACSWRDARN